MMQSALYQMHHDHTWCDHDALHCQISTSWVIIDILNTIIQHHLQVKREIIHGRQEVCNMPDAQFQMVQTFVDGHYVSVNSCPVREVRQIVKEPMGRL
jgi:hypothetical protein